MSISETSAHSVRFSILSNELSVLGGISNWSSSVAVESVDKESGPGIPGLNNNYINYAENTSKPLENHNRTVLFKENTLLIKLLDYLYV